MKIVEVRHPLVQHKLGLMRRADNSTKSFRELSSEVATLLTYEATADLETETVEIESWAGTPITVRRIKGRKITLVPILRAGIGMLPGVLDMIPAAKVSVVGLKRDEETLGAVTYYEKLVGEMRDRTALILDPMLATGGTLIATVDMLKAAGATRIKGLFLVAARRVCAPWKRCIPTWRYTPRQSMTGSMSAATSCPDWAMPETRFSVPARTESASATRRRTATHTREFSGHCSAVPTGAAAHPPARRPWPPRRSPPVPSRPTCRWQPSSRSLQRWSAPQRARRCPA